MLLTRDTLPKTIPDLAALDELVCRPSRALIGDLNKVDGDIIVLGVAARVTDCNSAFFEAANNFHGCIAGCHEVLRRQGLMQGAWCLDHNEGLSPGQREEIDRVCRDYADLSDDAVVAANLQKWPA
jgi:hypothetical protein